MFFVWRGHYRVPTSSDALRLANTLPDGRGSVLVPLRRSLNGAGSVTGQDSAGEHATTRSGLQQELRRTPPFRSACYAEKTPRTAMSNIKITLPDGSQQDVPAGSKPIDIARSISPRLADDAVVAQSQRRAVRPHSSARNRRHAPDPDLEGSGSARGLSALDRAPARRGRARAVSRNQARDRSAHRNRLLLRFPARDAVHSRRSRKDRDRRCGRFRRATSPTNA